MFFTICDEDRILDANNFARAHPATVGTRPDDCQLCRRAGVEGTSTKEGVGGKPDIENSRSYCHLIPSPDTTYTTGVHATYRDTLNDFGQDCMTAGREEETFAAIAAAGKSLLNGATGIRVFAPDGFKKDFTPAGIETRYPDGRFWYVDQSAMDPTPRFVTCPSTGRLEGEGPFRIIPPQTAAGRPDRGSHQPRQTRTTVGTASIP
jgi:hypothetical protein